jgi:hypothetical protein
MGLHWVMILLVQHHCIPKEMKPKIEVTGKQIAEEEYMDLERRKVLELNKVA